MSLEEVKKPIRRPKSKPVVDKPGDEPEAKLQGLEELDELKDSINPKKENV